MEKTILVVDDDVQIQNLLKVFLTERGFHVVLAKDGLAGLHGALNVHPDVVLLDLRMPMMDGISVLSSIREKAKLLPKTAPTRVIVMSANGDKETILRLKALKVDDFVVKPFDLKDLLARIQQLP